MTIQLTEQQAHALASGGNALPRVIDPRTNATYVLLPAEEYESVRELIENDRQQRAIRAIGLRNAVGRMESEP